MKIAVGDWVIYERLVYDRMIYQYSIDRIEFSAGVVVCVHGPFVMVQIGGMAVTIRTDLDEILFVGNRSQAFMLREKSEALLKKRHEAIKSAEDQVFKIAGEHAKAIRKMFKQKVAA